MNSLCDATRYDKAKRRHFRKAMARRQGATKEVMDPKPGPDLSYNYNRMKPTEAVPGSCEKLTVMADRLASGQPLFHPRDLNIHPLLNLWSE